MSPSPLKRRPFLLFSLYVLQHCEQFCKGNFGQSQKATENVVPHTTQTTLQNFRMSQSTIKTLACCFGSPWNTKFDLGKLISVRFRW